MTHLMETYKRLPIAFSRGDGVYLEDEKGNRYLDGLTGIAVCGLGHAHPRVTRALTEQAQTLLHTSNLYEIPLQSRLADRLCELSGMDKVFFGNSGAEANEAAIKSRAAARSPARNQQAGHRRDGVELSWQNDGNADRHRVPQSAGGIRTAAVRLRARTVQ